MSATIGFLGVRQNLQIRQGATFGPLRLTVRNPDNTPVDLTGSTLVGHIRKTAKAPVVLLELVGTIEGDSADGVWRVEELTAAQTAALAAGETPAEPASQYVYDLEWTDATGRVTPLLYGTVSVLREVTRAP